MTTNEADRIEKDITLKAPIHRVFAALTDTKEFGAWFGVRLDSGEFAAGSTLRGFITSPGYEHLRFSAVVEAVDAPRFMSYRWHPYAIDPEQDYSQEPTTLVSFELSEVPGGTHLRVIESGFENIPVARRAEAFRMNANGWSAQCKNLEAHLAKAR
jgi:uncharacterized protein YndB with AHSA1/START domain